MNLTYKKYGDPNQLLVRWYIPPVRIQWTISASRVTRNNNNNHHDSIIKLSSSISPSGPSCCCCCCHESKKRQRRWLQQQQQQQQKLTFITRQLQLLYPKRKRQHLRTTLFSKKSTLIEMIINGLVLLLVLLSFFDVTVVSRTKLFVFGYERRRTNCKNTNSNDCIINNKNFHQQHSSYYDRRYQNHLQRTYGRQVSCPIHKCYCSDAPFNGNDRSKFVCNDYNNNIESIRFFMFMRGGGGEHDPTTHEMTNDDVVDQHQQQHQHHKNQYYFKPKTNVQPRIPNIIVHTTTTSEEANDDNYHSTKKLNQPKEEIMTSSGTSNTDILNSFSSTGSFLAPSILFMDEDIIQFWIQQLRTYRDLWYGTICKYVTNIFWYEPPVGIVTFCVVTRLLLTRRLFTLYNVQKQPPQQSSSSKQDTQQNGQSSSSQPSVPIITNDYNKKNDSRKRCYHLDPDDVKYNQWGGIQPVRHRLCLIAIRHLQTTEFYDPNEKQHRMNPQQDYNSQHQQQQVRKDNNNNNNPPKKVSVVEQYPPTTTSTTTTHRFQLPSLPHVHKTTTKRSQQQQQQQQQQPSNDDQQPRGRPDFASSYHRGVLLNALHDVLSITKKPTHSRIDFVHDIVAQYSILERVILTGQSVNSNNNNDNPPLQPPGTSTRQQLEDISVMMTLLELTRLTAEIRTLDSVLRLCRDRVLQSAYRLGKVTEYWNRRGSSTSNNYYSRNNFPTSIVMNMITRWWYRIRFLSGRQQQQQKRLSDRDDEVRVRYAYALASYQSELDRLERIVLLLSQRPIDFHDTTLTYALKLSEQEKQQEQQQNQYQYQNPSSNTLSNNNLSSTNDSRSTSTEMTQTLPFDSEKIRDNGVKRNTKNSVSGKTEQTTSTPFWGAINGTMTKTTKYMISIVKTSGSFLKSLRYYTMEWRGGGSKTWFTIRRYNDDFNDGIISGQAAILSLLHHGSSNPVMMDDRDSEASSTTTTTRTTKKNDDTNKYRIPTTRDDEILTQKWITNASRWTLAARSLLCDIIQETADGCTSTSTQRNHYDASNFTRLREDWCTRTTVTLLTDQPPNFQPMIVTTTTNPEQNWKEILLYIENLSAWNRLGEGKLVRFRDVFTNLNIWKRLDIFGVPSSLCTIYISHFIHQRSIRPYWIQVRNEFIVALNKFVEILVTRFWDPVVGIYNDIMNKSPGMMTAFGLDVEEASLDRMLHDLGFGDGTVHTRKVALEQATRQYEMDVANGLITNVVLGGGRLVRLLLLQVQQLKVGMLSALDTIDVLLRGNRIHFQILAAIPAVLVLTVGTRYLFWGFYNIRARDIRPVTAVHYEMSHYLENVSNLLVTTTPKNKWRSRNPNDQNVNDNENQRPISMEQQQQVAVVSGEMIMNLYRYLILMDYCCPPFSMTLCDQIHQLIQEFIGGTGRAFYQQQQQQPYSHHHDEYYEYQQQQYQQQRNILLIQNIRMKHQELLKSL